MTKTRGSTLEERGPKGYGKGERLNRGLTRTQRWDQRERETGLGDKRERVYQPRPRDRELLMKDLAWKRDTVGHAGARIRGWEMWKELGEA